jgi:hypothetical protein
MGGREKEGRENGREEGGDGRALLETMAREIVSF